MRFPVLLPLVACAGFLATPTAFAWGSYSFQWWKPQPTGTTTTSTTTTSPAPAGTTGCTLSEADKTMLEAVNAARSQGRSCGGTYYAAATPLRWSCTLAQAALNHSTDMATHNFFSHTGSDGLRVGQRVSNLGYAWSYVGENIAAGYADVPRVMSAWLASPGHCASIMSSRYTELGAASVRRSGTTYGIYWTQVFARPR